MHPQPRIRLAIADDHEFFRDGFKNAIESSFPEEVEFVAVATNGSELIDAVATASPDVVLTDIQMTTLSGIEACRQIKSDHPQVEVVAFSAFTDTTTIMSMIHAGAIGYLSKNSNREEIINAIRSVRIHRPYYCSTVSEKLYGLAADSIMTVKKSKPIVFGDQEKKVMKLICRQLSTKEIASEMRLSAKTVEHYRQNIQEKIGARNVVGVALFALINQIVSIADLL